MALKKTVLNTSTTRAPLPRIQPAEGPGAVVQIPMETGSATWAIGTLISVITASGLGAEYNEAANGVTEEIYGVLINEITLDSSDNVIANVMVRGSAHIADIINAGGDDAAAYTGATAANIRAALKTSAVRERGLHIDGLDAWGTA